MTDVSQLAQVIDQLKTVGEDITPYALAAAKLGAISGIICNALSVASFVVLALILSLIGASEEKRDERGLLTGRYICKFADFIKACGIFIPIGFMIGCIVTFLGGYPLINWYGIQHPNVFLAYEALQKITGN